MLDPTPSPYSLGVLALLTVVLAAGAVSGKRFRPPPYLRYLWGFFLLLCAADWVSFRLAAWLFAVLSFTALREYFSLVDIRLEDRWGILGAYASIAFMTYFLVIDWYGMFIISIPVYTFVVIPLLVALGGGTTQGTVFSIGVIDLGLFLFAYCIGHIGYLAFFSVRMAMLFILTVAYCDLVLRYFAARNRLAGFGVACAGAVAFALLVSPWTTIPWGHCVVLGFLVPSLVFAGNFTVRAMEEDLGITPERLEPGRGVLLHSLKSYLFPAPIVFHYLRWFLHWGDLQ